jgi:hypothetical protein
MTEGVLNALLDLQYELLLLADFWGVGVCVIGFILK